MIDITDLNAEDRRKVLQAMSMKDLKAALNKLMADSRSTEINARLDALTVWALRKS